MGTRKQFTPEFKREAVQLLDSGSRSPPSWPANWGSGAINSINGSESSRHEERGRFPARDRASSGPRRLPA